LPLLCHQLLQEGLRLGVALRALAEKAKARLLLVGLITLRAATATRTTQTRGRIPGDTWRRRILSPGRGSETSEGHAYQEEGEKSARAIRRFGRGLGHVV